MQKNRKKSSASAPAPSASLAGSKNPWNWPASTFSEVTPPSPLMVAATELLEKPLQVRFPGWGLLPENGLPSATEVATDSAPIGTHQIQDFFITCFPMRLDCLVDVSKFEAKLNSYVKQSIGLERYN